MLVDNLGNSVSKSMVDILTGKERAIIYSPNTKDNGLAKIQIAINYTDTNGIPKVMMNGYDARGFIDGKSTYIIQNVEQKEIFVFNNILEIFWDADKFRYNQEYIYTGSIENIIQEFNKAEYAFKYL